MGVPVRKSTGGTGFVIALVAIIAVGAGLIVWQVKKTPPPVAITMPTSADLDAAKTAKGYSMGADSAKVEIVEFGDFECPACGRFATLTEPDVRSRLVATGLVRFTFYDFPITSHLNTLPAHSAAACANDQGKFWEMHDALYERQDEWNGQVTPDPRPFFASYGQRIGLDMARWNACMDASTHADRIKANYSLGLTRQVRVTPTFFVNGVALDVNPTFDNMKAAIDGAIAATRPIPASATSASQPTAK